MGTNIKVTDNSESGSIPVRRRNPQGSETELVSASIPKELAQKINGIVVKTTQSRSLVISELLAEAFAARERNGN